MQWKELREVHRGVGYGGGAAHELGPGSIVRTDAKESSENTRHVAAESASAVKRGLSRVFSSYKVCMVECAVEDSATYYNTTQHSVEQCYIGQYSTAQYSTV